MTDAKVIRSAIEVFLWYNSSNKIMCCQRVAANNRWREMNPIGGSPMDILRPDCPENKQCPDCKTFFPATNEFFHRDKTQKDGLRNQCKECRKQDFQMYIPQEYIVIDKKHCPACQRDFPATKEFFHRNAASKDGLQARCKSCVRERDLLTRKERNLKAKFNLTESDYQAMLNAQGGVCAICGKPETAKNQYGTRRLNVDHCHATGSVRGLLCSLCNAALGFLEEDPIRIKALLKYLGE